MLRKSRMKKRDNQRDIYDVEAFLQSKLKPVSPRPEFIRSLQRGLMDYTLPQTDPSEVDTLKAVFFALFGFAGLVFVFSVWIRMLLVMISTIGMLQMKKRQLIVKR